MPSTTPQSAPPPERLVLHRQSRCLEVAYANGEVYRLPFELLRVFSPSAEVRGHGPGQEILQTGKRDVTIEALEPIGNYAVRPRFSDGHETGIFSWDTLYDLGRHQEARWSNYLQRLQNAGASRDAPGTASDADANPPAAPRPPR